MIFLPRFWKKLQEIELLAVETRADFVRYLLEKGYTYGQIGDEIGITASRVHQIGKKYKEAKKEEENSLALHK